MSTIPKGFLPPKEYIAHRIFALPEERYPGKFNAIRHFRDNIKDWSRTAIYYKDEKITFTEVIKNTNKLANALKELGVEQYERIMLRLPNCPEFIYAYYACWTIGAIPVLVPNMLRKEEILHRANDSEAKVFIVGSTVWMDVEESIPHFKTVRKIVVVGERKEGQLFYDDLVKDQSDECEPIDVNRYDPVMLLYSSGTTGAPKGIIRENAAHFEHTVKKPGAKEDVTIEVLEEDVYGTPGALAYGMGTGLPLSQIFNRNAISLLNRPTPEEMLETIQKHKISYLKCVPTFYKMMLEIPDAEKRYDTSSLRWCGSAGEWLPGATRREWIKRFKVDIVDNIGCAEMGSIFAQPHWCPDEKADSSGKLMPELRMRVVDENFNDVPAGTFGEVLVQGPTPILYWRQPEAQKNAVHNGWNRTGLVGRMDKDGYFWLKSRVDDMIVTSGYKVPGGEVENALMSHPAVHEAAVVPSPDRLRGSIVKAFVVLRKGFEPSDELQKELQDHVKAKLEPYKYPRKIEFVDGKKLPRAQMGKILRRALAEMEQKGGGTTLTIFRDIRKS